MNETININAKEDLERAIQKIKSENLVPAKEPYISKEDPIISLTDVRRWNFKKPNTEDINAVLHLVYPLNSKEKIESIIRQALNSNS